MVNLGPATEIPLPSIMLKGWYDMGLCWQFWDSRAEEHPGVPHVCMSSLAIPHQCTCVHEEM